MPRTRPIPSLWRQGKLVAKHGLFELTDGVYQVRGLDLSNMSLVETDTGVIVIDTLMSDETAAAALALYRKHRGDRPVKALLITHSHADHYGGSAGVADADTPVYAPSGFLAHAVSENVYAGAAMSRRAAYIYAADLPAGPAGQIGAGLGMATSNGTISLLAPTVDVTHTGQEARELLATAWSSSATARRTVRGATSTCAGRRNCAARSRPRRPNWPRPRCSGH